MRSIATSLGIPEATLIVSLTAIGLGFMSNVATRFLVDLKKEKRLRAETAAFDKELRQAVMKKDKAKEEKLRKIKPQMDQMKLKASTGRFKVLIVTWVPFILVYYFMGDFVSGCKFPSICISTVVATSPLQIPFIVGANGTMVLLWWYFLSSLTFGTIISKLLGTAPTT
ncbi:MAG: EMC3/TMCO1 family protein [Nitrososphaerales archaeon]